MNEAALPPARWLAPLLLATAALCWAGNHIIARAAVGHIQPWTLNALRWGLVSALIGVFAWRSIRRDVAAMRSRAWTLALLGAVGGGLFGGLQFQAANHTSALNMGVMNSVAPAFIVAAGIAFFRDSVSLRQVFGLVVSLAGVLAIVSRLDPERLAALSFNGGDLLLVFNMALWGGYSACLRLRPPTQTTSFLFASSVAALLVSLPPAALELHAAGRLELDVIALGAVAYSVLFAGILSYLCWARGIAIVGSMRASPYLHLVPLYASVLATTLLGEAIGLYHPVGLVLILAGVTLTTARARV